ESRLNGRTVSPDDAANSVRKVRDHIDNAQALGDLAGLQRRLDALDPVIEQHRQERRAERAQRMEHAQQEKQRIVGEAEDIAAGTDYRHGVDRLRALTEEWKSTPRIDRKTDDEPWPRFSAARTGFTRRRKAHCAEQAARRDEAARVKEKLIAEAEELSTSTDWGPTSRKYRDLMQRWKQAGSAPRSVDDTLRTRVRADQDIFFTARDAANAQIDAQYQANAEVKEQILAEAEALLP